MIGTQIGPFILVRLLGAGGMGSVYMAEHSLMKDLHAIKILDPQLTQSPQVVTRFVNEARAAARLRHRNLVRVHNIDRMPNDGPWFMVLDYLDGATLARFMASQQGPIAPHVILHILGQVANCIQHVHDNQIVHRDLKPENIFLIQHGEDPHFPIVLDLGVAQLNGELATGPATKTGTVIGTPIYMAPEQLRGERVTPAADIFALGIIAYEMSTGGYFPYQYDEQRSGYFDLPATEIYYRQRSNHPFDPRRRVNGLSEAWVKVLYAALDGDPRKRPASARDLALMFAEAIASDGIHPGGPEILRHVARELTQNRNSDTNLRPSYPPMEIARPPHADYRPPAVHAWPPGMAALATAPIPVAEPVSTLAGAASQSVQLPRAHRRRALLAGAAVVVMATTVGAFAIARMALFPSPRNVDAGPAATATVVPKPVEAATTMDAGSLLVASVTTVDAPAPPDAGVAADAPAADAGVAAARAVVASPPPTPTSHDVSVQKKPPAVAARKPGELAIIARPWAMIWLNDKPLGETPFRQTIAAGRYRLRLANEDAGRDETTVVTINPDQTTTIERSW